MAKTFLLIGGNSGIGLETAKMLQHQGANLIVASRSSDQLSKLGIQTQAFDAENPSQLDLPDQLDGLIYFPGTINLKPFHRLTSDDFKKEFQINFLAAVDIIQQALPALKAAPTASIVMFSTVAVAQGMPFHASIASSKGAIEGLTKSLAAEFAPKIRVNAIAPALTDTPLVAHLLGNDAKREASAKRHPLQAVGTAKDVATIAAYLLSDASKFITGQIQRPDGGLSTVRTF
ncbi:SDR family NAD(P)-dependent oxidoreductase [Luteolibacter sp. AS25]|uniref:SDR family NAD(P)-dependent oxidoreductase n=1 Tax=Luteolibacter sp. AS25 TaxID=3135776 RepID=UPI00398B408A